MIQGIGLIVEGFVNESMKLDKMASFRGIKNVLLFSVWFHITFKLLGDDLERGGFWW